MASRVPVSVIVPRLRSRRKRASDGDRLLPLAFAMVAGRRTGPRLLRRGGALAPVTTALYAARLAKAVIKRGAEVVAVERLDPGQFVRIEAIDPETLDRQERRLYRR